ncbi:MAG: hypothetical protein IKJ68_08605 [Clostridia bacterium]|nr:hypothetical protein [Clostridia bacterium]
MKKRLLLMLIVTLSLVLGNVTTTFADAAAYDMEPANYYVYVSTPDGGLNMRHGPGTDYAKVMDQPIPDGVKLYIGYVSDNWGYTEYNGNSGWVALKQTYPAQSEPSNETYTRQKAGYNVYVAAPDGGVNMRKGPDKTYPKVMQEMVPNGIKVYIEYVSGDWGYGAYNGYLGWIFLPQTTTTAPDNTSANTDEPVELDDVDNPLNSISSDEDDESEEPAEPDESNESAEPVDSTPASSADEKEDAEKVKDSMTSQILLGAGLLVAIVGIAVCLLMLVNKKSKKQ